MKRHARLVIAIASLCGAPMLRASAQTAVFAGAVVRDTLSHGISGALVSIPALGRSDTSDARGEFKLAGLASGRFAVLIRRIGFQAMVDTVVLVNGTSVEREYVMDANVVQLDSVRVMANPEQHLSARMAQFEEHRKYATGGHFITDSLLRKNESRAFGDMLTSYVPGIHLFHPFPKTRPTMEYIASARGICAAYCMSGECPVTLFIDGIRYYSAADRSDMPDMTGFQISNYAGVEYYAGGASVPLIYNATGSGCGTLVLWSREKLSPLTI